MSQGRTNRNKAARHQRRIANLLSDLLDRDYVRNLEEYRTANDGDVSERIEIDPQTGQLATIPLPLAHECKTGKIERGEWRDAILEAEMGARDGDLPIGWVHAERFWGRASLDFCILRVEDWRLLNRLLEDHGIWSDAATWYNLVKVANRRPRWRDAIEEAVEGAEHDEFAAAQLRVIGAGPDRNLHAVLIPEEDFLEILYAVHVNDLWSAIRVNLFDRP